MTGLVIGIVVLVLVVGIGCCYFADLNDKLPKMARKGPMYPKILARNGDEYIKRNDDKWDICAICRQKYVPTPNAATPGAQIGFNHITGNLYCNRCKPRVESGSICSENNLPPFISDPVLYKSLHSHEILMMTLVSDIEHGDISVNEAKEVMKQVADKMFLKTFKRGQGIPSATSWLDSISSCGLCGGEAGHCRCYDGYVKDCQNKRIPSRIVPYLKRLQELDPDYKDHFSEYYRLEDWQNIQMIMREVSEERLSRYYAEKQIDAYIDTMIPDLKAQINHYEALKRGEKPGELVLPSDPPKEVWVPPYQKGMKNRELLEEKFNL